LTIASGCGGDGAPAEDLQGSEEAIVGGTNDSGDPSIIEIVIETDDGGFTCTGTFIGPRTVLTAGHCVTEEDDPQKLVAGATFTIQRNAVEDDATKTDRITVPRANVHVHPGYDGEAAHDVAILVLAKDVKVKPIPILREPMTKSMIGKKVRIVGYGMTSATASDDEQLRKRVTTTTIRGIDGDLVHIGDTGHQACDGDSGGPALLKIDGVETLIATDDLASDDNANCKKGDLYQRVDRHLDFIDKFL
jgi:V8-like Glu-specific endopeptidase